MLAAAHHALSKDNHRLEIQKSVLHDYIRNHLWYTSV